MVIFTLKCVSSYLNGIIAESIVTIKKIKIYYKMDKACEKHSTIYEFCVNNNSTI